MSTKLIFGVTLIALMVAGASVSASARTIEIAPAGAIEGQASRLTFEGGSGLNIICDVTLGGIFERRIVGEPRLGLIIGTIESGRTAGCGAGNDVRMLFATQWRVHLIRLLGNEIEIAILPAQFLISFGGFSNCLYTILFVASNGGINPVSTLTVGTVRVLELITLGGICPSSPSIRGRFSLRPAQRFTSM